MSFEKGNKVRLGKNLTEETKRKISESNKCHQYYKHKPDCKCCICKTRNGEFRHTEETKKKLSTIKTGLSLSEETRKKISENLKGKNTGEKNGMWKGDDAGYDAIHIWVRKNKPKPQLCVMCGKSEPQHIASITGEAKRDISNYLWLCVSCHRKFDRKLKKLICSRELN